MGHSTDGKTIGIATFAVVPSDKGKTYVLVKSIDDDEVFLHDKVTQHFIKRYRERRLKKEDISTEKVISLFFMTNQRRLVVYKDPEDPTTAVYATKEGLAICHRDEKNGFLELATYIDDSMLYANQRIAKEKAFSKIPDEIKPEHEYYIQSILSELIPMVQEIYSKHKSGAAEYLVFKNENAKEEVNLDFKLTNSKEKAKQKTQKEQIKEEKSGTSFPMPNAELIRGNNDMMIDLFRNELRDLDVEIRGNRNGRGKVFYKEKGKTVMEYKGDLIDGMPNGQGKLNMRGGHVYEGTFVNGDIDGQCRHTYPNGTDYEEGVFKGIHRNGYVHTHMGEIDSWSMFVNDERVGLLKITARGITYEGDFKKGTLNGKGSITYEDGYKKIGTFKNGMLKGKGKAIDVDGSVIEANFVKGVPSGLGTKTMPDGIVYQGSFEDGELNGWVLKMLPDGSKEEVEFFYGDLLDPDWDEEWELEEDYEDFDFEDFEEDGFEEDDELE